MSGAHRLIKVTNLSYWFNDGYGPVQMIVATQQQSGQIAAATGGSGGPVLVPYFGGTSVAAAGMMQAIDNLVGCTPTAFATRCGKTVLFTSMRMIVNTLLGASLRTYLTTASVEPMWACLLGRLPRGRCCR